MRIAFDRKTKYVPKWEGNDKLPTDEQIVVHYKTPTLEDRKALMSKPKLVFQFGADGNAKGGEMEYELDTGAFVKRLVTGIDNLETTDPEGNNAKPIRTADELLAGPATLSGLVEDISKELQRAVNGLTDDAKKN